MNYNEVLDKTIEAVRRVGEFIKNEQIKISAKSIETKGVHDFVTYVDKNSEKELVLMLQAIIPEAGFITEEKTISKTGDKYNWIIDPLDGTTNYIHGLSPVAISVALQEDNKTVLGVVYEISLDECFYAVKNKGAFLNGKSISVSNTDSVQKSLIATGFPYYNYNKLPQFMESLSFFMKNSHGLRRLGSAATDLVYVACGRVDAFYEYSLHVWDVAAGAFIIEEAGGKVSDFMGGDDFLYGKEIIASNSNIFDEFLNQVKNIMQ